MIHHNIINIAKSINKAIINKDPNKDFTIRYCTPSGDYEIIVKNAKPIENWTKIYTSSLKI